ncbi:MAG: EF-hand domain-containing protein [Hydrogenophaga sp.]|nr:EF-hand domain-containing protein [Hydrogenophaga sp.]
MSTVDLSSNSAWAQSLATLNGALSSQLQDKMMSKMDTDGSGSVDQSEFQVALEKLAGKLGVNVGEGSAELYGSLDADQDGSLNAGEVGSLVQSVLGALAGAQSYTQSRGDEASFAAMDGNGDGVISREEYGLAPEATQVVTTTTTTTYGAAEMATPQSASGFSNMFATLFTAAIAGALARHGSGDEVVAEGEGEPEMGAVEEVAEAGTGTEDTQLAAADEAKTSEDNLARRTLDHNGDGRISRREFMEAAARMQASQTEAASKRYNDTLLAQMDRTAGTRRSRLNASA